MIWIAVGATLVVIVAVLFWRWRRRQRHRLISLVALLREPATFDPAVLASVAGRIWNADLGDGSSEGADGFVVGVGVMNTIMHQGRFYLINSIPKPYVQDVQKTAEGIADLRLRSLFMEHRAWFSCDALGIDGKTSAEEIRDWYHRLGALFAELLDENCLMIFIPDIARGYPINEDTETALHSPDPVGALQETLTLPILEVSDDDPLMKHAVQQARENWPRFVAAYEERAGENFSVKAPITREGNTEFIWISVTSLEGERIYGELGNEPGNLGSLKLGSKVSVLVSDLNDWCYLDPQGKMAGGFTVEVVQKALRKRRGR